MPRANLPNNVNHPCKPLITKPKKSSANKIPNAETRQVFAVTDRGMGIITCENVGDLFKQLGIVNHKIDKSRQKSRRM